MDQSMALVPTTKHLDSCCGAGVKVDVEKSGVLLTWPDGDTVKIDVAHLYSIFAAHLYQNGLAHQLDYAALNATQVKGFNHIERTHGDVETSIIPHNTVAIHPRIV